MARLKNLIVELHRRSLWQVFLIYLGASWAVLEAVDHVVERYYLPEWVSAAAVILLLIGLPIVLATAFVREEPWQERGEEVARRETAEPRSGGMGAGESATGSLPDRDESPSAPLAALERSLPAPLIFFLTWPKAILGGVLAFIALGLVSAFIVVQGLPRMAEASGSAGEAFEERAWVVIPEFQASEGDAEVGLAARTALTLDLQQSRYVNVFGRRELGPVLRRMGLPDTVSLDVDLALEVAERQGLAAVLVGSVSRLGSDYVLGARAVEPATGREIIVVKTAAREERLLDGVQGLSRELRSRLGEAGDEISQSKPLPEVTTRSLEALKKFARARHANEVLGYYDQAAEFAEEAIRVDSSFASAYLMAAVAHSNVGRLAEARRYATHAYERLGRLPDRERLAAEAFYYYVAEFDPRQTVETYELLLAQYPDDGRALNNIGVMSGVFLGDYERSFQAYRAALEVMPSPIALENATTLALLTGRMEAADSLIRRAREEGYHRSALENQLERAFFTGDWNSVEAFCDSLLAESEGDGLRAADRRYCGTTDIARGRLRRGLERLETASRTYERAGQHINLANVAHASVMAEVIRGRPDAARARLAAWLDRFPADSIGDPDRFVLRTQLLLLAGLLESEELVERVRSTYPGGTYKDSTHWLRRYGDGISDAADALATGQPRLALERLRAASATGYRPFFWIPWTELLYGLAFDALGQTDSAIAHLSVAVERRNLGIRAFPDGRANLPMLLRHLGELEEASGDDEAAFDYYRRLLELWSDADPELRDEVAAVRRAAARLADSERDSGSP